MTSTPTTAAAIPGPQRADGPFRHMARIAAVMAMAAGIIDVSLALLYRPRSFEVVTTLPTPALVAAVALLGVYIACWSIVRPLATRSGLAADSADVALAAFLGTGFTLTVMTGLHTAPLSPHSVFKAAIVFVLSAMMSAGVYSAHERARRHAVWRRYGAATGLALPVLLFEILMYQWVVTYAIESVASWSFVVVTAGSVLVVTATIALFLRTSIMYAPLQVLSLFALFLLAVPMLGESSTFWSKVASPRTRAASASPRVILISVDTLRADVLSSYRADADPTENIDALARDGVLFERAIAPSPWTLPSVASMLTGLSPTEHLATSFQSPLSDKITTLAEHLSGRGFYTSAIVHNALLHKGNNLTQGFAEYVDLYQPWFGGSVGARLLQAVLPASSRTDTWPSTADQTQVVIDWLEANHHRSFFLWVHYLDPHAPYEPPAAYLRDGERSANFGSSYQGQSSVLEGLVVPTLDDRRSIRGLYDAEVQYVDASIGQLTATLKRLNIYDDTVIVLTSDHGEEFWEHGLQGHGHSLYSEVLRVPLIVKVPGASHRGRTLAAVSTASITPTVLDLLGFGANQDTVSAPSLVPLLDPAENTFEDRPVVSTAQALYDRQESVIFDGFKYIVSRIDGREELFDTVADPGDQRSLAASAPDRLARGRHLLEQHGARAAAIRKRLHIDQDTIPLDDDLLRRLRSVGYVR